MEQLLVIVFLSLLVGWGTVRKRKNARQATARPHPRPHPRPQIPVEDIFPLEREFVEEPVRQQEESGYVFAGMEASQETEPDAETLTSSLSKMRLEKETAKPASPSMETPEFSLRDAVINQVILERKYH